MPTNNNGPGLRSRFAPNGKRISKVVPLYPAGAERAYIRAVNAYMGLLQDVVKAEMPLLREAVRKHESQRVITTDADGEEEFSELVRQMFVRVRARIREMAEKLDMVAKLRYVVEQEGRNAQRQWRKAAQETLGIDLRDDYFSSTEYQAMVDDWVRENVSFISGLMEPSIRRMEVVVRESFWAGRSPRDIARDVQATYTTTKNHALFIARDQIGTLNAKITQQQQTSCGVNEYIWSGCMDGRERDTHRALEGKRFRWDDPPDTGDGRRCHPGEDYQCRCVARPIFDFDTIKGEGV